MFIKFTKYGTQVMMTIAFHLYIPRYYNTFLRLIQIAAGEIVKYAGWWGIDDFLNHRLALITLITPGGCRAALLYWWVKTHPTLISVICVLKAWAVEAII